MGQTTIFCIYASFCLSSFFSSSIIKKLGHQKSLFLSGLTYCIYISTGLVIITEMPIPKSVKWCIVILWALICGLGASILWVSQGSYISETADSTRKSQLFGLFWIFQSSGTVLGDILIIFILGKVDNITYSLLTPIFVIFGSLLFLCLPNTSYSNSLD